MIAIALGANLPGPDGRAALQTCRAAAVALDALPGLRLAALSRWYATAPEPPSLGAPDYVNGVALLVPRASWAQPDPAALLAALQSIEAAFGRVRPYPNAPRTLDLDIVAMGDLMRDAPDPILPHPRMHQRSFVLAPLCDVAAGWRHPRLDRTAAALLRDLGVALAPIGADGYMSGSP